MRRPAIAAVVALAVLVWLSAGAGPASADGWTQVNSDGFGDSNNTRR